MMRQKCTERGCRNDATKMHREGCRNDATKMHREAKRTIIEMKLLKLNNLICIIQNNVVPLQRKLKNQRGY